MEHDWSADVGTALRNINSTCFSTVRTLRGSFRPVTHVACAPPSCTRPERLVRDVHLVLDGAFGPVTEAAMRLPQGRAGITVNGVVGALTHGGLNL